MQNFVAKITKGISTFFMGLTLTILQFDATKYDLGLPQSDAFYKYIWPIYILGPALGSLFFAIPVLFIKYNVNDRKRIEQELKALRAKKEAEMAGQEMLEMQIYT